jgi:hypothetical protein
MPQPRKKTPKTKPMPLDEAPELTEWAKKQKKPTPDDKGETPPEPPEDIKEPRDHGAKEPDEEGAPT